MAQSGHDDGASRLPNGSRPQGFGKYRDAMMIRISPQPDTGEVLAGLVERVTYHNAENGFCVLRARARGHRDLVTVVGHAAAISAGEWIMASGRWVNDRTHGQQFKARLSLTVTSAPFQGPENILAPRARFANRRGTPPVA
jgi:hypothetical protein